MWLGSYFNVGIWPIYISSIHEIATYVSVKIQQHQLSSEGSVLDGGVWVKSKGKG